MAGSGKSEEKQNNTNRKAKANMVALWTAVATMLGTTGIPKIVEMLENKPSVEQVSGMIAQQTERLTVAQNEAVEALNELQEALRGTDVLTKRLEGRFEFLKDIVGDCCTRVSARRRLAQPPAKAGGAAAKPAAPKLPKAPAKKLKKLPAFSIEQQQVQAQVREPKK